MTRLLAALLLLALAGCSSAAPRSGTESYRRGLAALEAGTPRLARIEFLNAIQREPANPDFRIAQARTLIALGDGRGASAELDQAAPRVDPTSIAHLRAHALLLQGRPDEALREAGGAMPVHAAYAERIRAGAYVQAVDPISAGTAFDRSLALDPTAADTWIDLARFRRSRGNMAGAIEAADRAVSLAPKQPKALALRGEITRTQYGLRAALPWFDRALAIDKDNVPVLLERAATLADLGAGRATLADTRAVLALSPGNPVALQLQALMAARAGRFALARALYQRTKGALDANPATQLLAAAIEVQTSDPLRAARRMEALLQRQPANIVALRLLTAARLRLDDLAGAINALRPLTERPDAQAQDFSRLSVALRRQGDVAGAAAARERALRFWQRAPTSWLVEGDVAATVSEAEANPDDAGAQVRTIRALLTTGRAADAAARVRRLEEASPGSPDVALLAGDAAGAAGDWRNAAEAYRRAANLSFTAPVAMRLVAALGRMEADTEADRVLRLFIRQNPGQPDARLVAGAAAMARRDWAQAIALLEPLRLTTAGRDAALLTNLSIAWEQAGNADRAITSARGAWIAAPHSPATRNRLGWLLIKTGHDRATGLALLLDSQHETFRNQRAARAS